MDRNYAASRATSLRHFLTIVFRRFWMIVAISLLAVTAGLIQLLTIPHSYEASAKLLLERDPELEKAMLLRVSSGSSNETSAFSYTQESELMTSRPVMERVIVGLKLFGFADTTLFKTPHDREAALQYALREMQKGLSVVPSTDPNIIKVKYKSTNADQAAAIVNELVTRYIEYRFEIFSEDQNLAFLNEQIEDASGKLASLQNQRALYQKEGTLYTPDKEGDLLFTKLKDYESRADALKMQRISKESKLRVLRDVVASNSFEGLAAVDVGAGDAQITNILALKSELWTLENDRERLRQKYTDDFIEVKEKTTEIDALRKRITDEIKQIITGLQASVDASSSEEATLRGNAASIQGSIRGLSGKDLAISRLTRSIAETDELYSALQRQREEAKLSRSKKEMVVRVKVISAAVPPLDPIPEHKAVKLILVLLLGIFAGISIAFFLDFFDHSFKNADDVQRYLNLDILASIRSFEKP